MNIENACMVEDLKFFLSDLDRQYNRMVQTPTPKELRKYANSQCIKIENFLSWLEKLT